MSWNNYSGVSVTPTTGTPARPRFSLTSDIVGFRRCSRQYGYFGNDGFVPAHTVQIFYGTIVHQVLDKCHRHYSGLLGGPARTLPTDADIENYFDEVEAALRAHGVRAINPNIRDRALFVLKAFNRIEGPSLYERVVDTEYRLESEQPGYVMRGVVDVLADAKGGDGDVREIWDYKGTNRPGGSDPALQDYKWQMCVYAELYKVRNGIYPTRAVLYFLNELHTPSGVPPLTARPPRAVLEVNFTPKMIADALREFDLTAHDIINCKSTQTWPSPVTTPGPETCDICDIRWNCPSHPSGSYPLRKPV